MRLLVAALIVASGTVYAADKFDVQDVRKSFIGDCTSRGISRGDDAERVVKFCSCTFDTMALNLTVAEYLEVDRMGKEGRNPQSLPAMQRVMPKLTQCPH